MKRNLFFILMAAILLTPWPVAYAYDSANGENLPVTVQAADPSSAPQLKAYGNAIGHVTPGDLFEVDMTDIMADTLFNMLITNTDELVRNYRFMTLKIGIYRQAAGAEGWENLAATGGEELEHIYITMHGDMANFTLPGGARYRITIETGCFYCYGIAEGTSVAVPAFYITAGTG